MARGAGRGGNGARGRGAKARGEAVPAEPEEASPTNNEVPKANSILAAFDRLNQTVVPSPVSIASTADVGGSSPSAGGSSPPSVPLGQLTSITPHHGNANNSITLGIESSLRVVGHLGLVWILWKTLGARASSAMPTIR
jgi:hypothetical protein